MKHIQQISPHKPSVKTIARNRMLTKRQIQCLRLAANGLTARNIAQELGVTERMVRTHLREARTRLEAHSTAEAVYHALKQELLE